ncbi:MAG: hypothetical protein Ct9H300mP8_03840 [Gammaproteobacteria bacterium]|nr:MAG: hypothetical protein Ct9H300mP8_03840 [Gammaproteobacteria bacterium]
MEGAVRKDVAFHEPFSVFSFMAAITEKIGFATSGLILPQRQTALSPNKPRNSQFCPNYRFRLGIGTGFGKEVEYEALKFSFFARGKRQAEQVKISP